MSSNIDPLEICLHDHIPEDVTDLKTRTWGLVLRIATRIDNLAENAERINVIVPGRITAISITFLREFFVNIIIKLHTEGKEPTDCIKLISENNYDFNVYLEYAVNQVVEKEFA
jgi:hypothetical protein